MGEPLHISTLVMTIFGSGISLLLAIVAFFLNRLINQFDGLKAEFKEMNTTFIKIDKDLSGDVGVLKSRMQEYDQIWDRLRKVETEMVAVQSGGCDFYHSKIHAQ